MEQLRNIYLPDIRKVKAWNCASGVGTFNVVPGGHGGVVDPYVESGVFETAKEILFRRKGVGLGNVGCRFFRGRFFCSKTMINPPIQAYRSQQMKAHQQC